MNSWKPLQLHDAKKAVRSKVLLVLDSGPLGLLSNPVAIGAAREVQDWAQTRLSAGDQIFISEIADYEVRRELWRANKEPGISRLNDLSNELEYLPLTTEVMQDAAILWANARKIGLPTAHDKALDVDVILAAQARNLQAVHSNESVIVITSDVSHLSRYVQAKRWMDV